MFMARNLVQPVTDFLLKVLNDNKPEHASLQTRLIEINIQHAPQVADAILGNGLYSHYDRGRVAELWEANGFPEQAVKQYHDSSSPSFPKVRADAMN